MQTENTHEIKRPHPLLALGESRMAFDIGAMALKTVSGMLKKPAKPKHRSIVLLPGFYSDEKYMAPLGQYLRKLGYEAEGWGLGRNMGGADLDASLDKLDENWGDLDLPIENGEADVPYLCDKAKEQIRRKSLTKGRPITLIGWSLGGFIAREVARDLPDHVDQVITMGAPIIGGPKYTSAAPLFSRRGTNLDFIEAEILKRESRLIQQPITAIYSKTDAVVAWKAAIDHHSPQVNHIEVNAAHLGMGFNQGIWKIIKKALLDFEFE